MATSPRAIPVRVTQKAWRQLVIEADPDYYEDSENPIEYEYKTRKFRGRYKHRGAYADD